MIAIFPEIASASVSREFELLGVLVRQYFAGEKKSAPQINVLEIAHSAGLNVARASNRNSGFGAVVARDHAGRVDVSMILAPDALPVQEENFLAAHLLGHWLLHIQPSIARGEWKTSGYSDDVLPSTYFDGQILGPEKMGAADRLESEANHFAMCLLLPKGMIDKAFERISDLDRLAAFFQVPHNVLKCRLIQLGHIQAPIMDFSAAERRMRGTVKEPVSTLGGRELINALADKINTDQPKASVPRSFAASSYGSMQRQTETPHVERDASRRPNAKQSPVSAQPVVKVSEKSDTPSDVRAKPGLDRIRDLARRMDPTVK